MNKHAKSSIKYQKLSPKMYKNKSTQRSYPESIAGMQDWIDTRKSISVIHYINSVKKLQMQ